MPRHPPVLGSTMTGRPPGQATGGQHQTGNPAVFVGHEWRGTGCRGGGGRSGSGPGWWVSRGLAWTVPDVANGVPDLSLDRALLVVVGSVSKAGAFRHQAGGRIVHVGPE